MVFGFQRPHEAAFFIGVITQNSLTVLTHIYPT